MSSAIRLSWIPFLIASVVLVLCLGAFAQGGAGELTGLVTDATGAVVSGVEVKLTNTATGEERTTVTGPSGNYSFPALPIVGTYTLEVASKGFKSTKVQNVVVSVGTITTRDVKLEVGAATEQVTVEAGQQIVQTEDSSLSQLIDKRVWEDLPLVARNPNDFINLIAGAVPEQIAGATFRGASVNGTRTGTGNFMVEGLDNNEQGQGGVAICGTVCGQGGSNTSISPDAIEEYRVITHDFSAEYGKAGGFVTDTVLKGGTNQWHGSLFEYNRVQALAANDWFSNVAGLKDHLVRNQFGGSIGGPIVKDKTFFYFTMEEQRFRTSSPVTGTSMTQQFFNFVQSGAFEQFQEGTGIYNTVSANGGYSGVCRTGTATAGNNGTPCPGVFAATSTIGPLFQGQITAFPLAMPLVNASAVTCPIPTPTVQANPSCLGEGPYTGAINYPVPIFATATLENPTPLNQLRWSVKFDHSLTTNDRLDATYLYENVTTSSPFFGGSITTFGVPLVNPNRAQTLGVTWSHTISPTVLNQVKIGYVRRTANFTVPGTASIPSLFSIDALASGFGANPGLPQFFTENLFQYKDDVSVTKGKHTLKFGGEYRRTRNGSTFDNDKYGHFGFFSTEDFITDGLFTDTYDKFLGANAGNGGAGFGGFYYAGASVVPSTGAIPDFYRGYRANEVAIYGQDDWRVMPRLTVNLGLRWEYFGPPHNFKPNIDSNLYFGGGTLPLACPAPCNPFFPVNSQSYAFEADATFQIRNSSIWNKNLKNFGPRVGFAWDVLGNQKVVLRSGFGIFYDRMYNNIFENIRFNAPYFADEVTGIGSGVPLGPLKNPGLYTIPFANNADFVNPAFFPNGLPKPVPRHMDQDMMTPYYIQESFGLQYAAAKDLVLETSYVGTLGRKLLGIVNLNTFDGRTAAGLNGARPNPIINSDNARGNFYSSNYNALDVTLRKRFSHGLSFNASYTYSKAMDELSDVFRTASAAVSATDVQNLKNDYGPADFDVRHRVVFSSDYDLPIFHGNRWLGGWRVNSIISWNTGAPIVLFDGGSDSNKDGTRIDRPNYVGTGSVLSHIVGREQNGTYQYLDPGTLTAPNFVSAASCLTNPAINVNTHGGAWCDPNLARGAIPGPMFANVDLGISKTFKVTERSNFRFDANLFDLFNHPNFANPGYQADGSNNFQSPNFGQSITTYGEFGGHRVVQLAIRFDF